jgi:hypothetical protein
MPRKARKFSDADVAKLHRSGLHHVGGVLGLGLYISKSGSRGWVLRYMLNGRRRDMGLGGYPEVTLATARRRARWAREMIFVGVDPIEARRLGRKPRPSPPSCGSGPMGG